MYKSPSDTIASESQSLSEAAQALLAASADIAGDSIVDARKRLEEALEHSKHLYTRVKDQVVEGAKATDTAVHDHPYWAISVAAGCGCLVGMLLKCCCTRKNG